jgi:hypothetical protein
MASRKGRGVCPSCTGRRMAESAAHLADRVIPPVPVRQWVISVPKRLRGVLADRPAAVTALTRIFLDEIERWLGAAVGCVPDAAACPSLRPRLGSARPPPRERTASSNSSPSSFSIVWPTSCRLREGIATATTGCLRRTTRAPASRHGAGDPESRQAGRRGIGTRTLAPSPSGRGPG